jgi:putative endopeptidase
MVRNIVVIAGISLLAACVEQQASKPAAAPAGLTSGIDLTYVDHSVRPQDDVYRYLNGKWLDTFPLPADKAQYSASTGIIDRVQVQLKEIVDALPSDSTDADTQKLVDLYASFMDEQRLDSLGFTPLHAEFAAIDAMSDVKELPARLARMNRAGVGVPLALYISQDAKDSTQYAVSITQSGLGMPDRDYYLKDDAKLKEARDKYRAHIARLLQLAGDAAPAADAAAILTLETTLAQAQWTRVENRDPVKTYNKTELGALSALMPGYDWQRYLQASGVEGKANFVIVRQPTYLNQLSTILARTPLSTWKAYCKWHVLTHAAPYLSKPFVDERFSFAGTVLRGVPENQVRWKRGLNLIDDSMGEALGRLYVARYFPPENKARMQKLVANLMEAYRRDIDTLDWMSPDTKVGARQKLAHLVPKIGYPDVWRDYGALKVSRTDLYGNVVRAEEFEYQRDLDKLGKPIDRTEWRMTPQTVNASYNPTRNEITFPAAILQPPFFDPKADDASIYGGIGGVIGHEISHGFDDSGSQYDGEGNLHDWFTPADHDKFKAKTQALVAQYEAYQPVPDYHVNGALTLGENIGDNSGLAIAYKAYKLSLNGAKPFVIDGLSGDQRFYLGWVQAWRAKTREAEVISRIKSDPHSPAEVRGIAPLRNQEGFYAAFGVKPGDKMYLSPAERVNIW